MVDVSEVNDGDRQRSAEVHHPPGIRLVVGHRTAGWTDRYVRVPVTIHRVAGLETVPDADLMGRKVGGYVTDLVRIRWTQL